MAIGLQSGSPTTPFNDTGAGSTTSFSLTNVTNGCGVVVLFGIQNSPSTSTSVTADCGGTAMTAIGSLFNNSGQQLQIFYIGSYPGSTGTKTVTITPSAASFYYTSSGFAFTGPISLDSSGSSSSTDNVTFSSTANNCFGVSIAQDGNAEPGTDTGFTTVDLGNPNTYTRAQYKLDMGAAGSKTFTQTGAAFSAILAAMFADAGGGGSSIAAISQYYRSMGMS